MSGPPRKRPPTADELALWRTAMRDVVPFRGVAAEPGDPAEPAPAAPPPPPTLASPPPVPGRVAPPVPHRLPPLKVGTAAGVDRRTDDRLRRGQLLIEARLDLHGMTQVAAHEALARFLDGSRRLGRRCVLVITGKGPAGEGGVLRNAVPRWLAEPALRKMIVAIHRAQPCHGGDGALYVLIKKNRAASE